MPLYFTGDTHGEFGRFFFDPEFKLIINDYEHCMPERDVIFITGDFGGVWFNKDESDRRLFEQAEKELDKLEKLPFTIVFVDGNHENFPRLDAYPIVEKFGGKVNRIRNNLFRLKQRGHIYELLGKKILCFGGAVSYDQIVREKGLSWWPQEQAEDDDYIRCIRELSKANWKVDYIATHIAPIEAMDEVGDYRTGYWRTNPDLINIHDPLPTFLQFIAERTMFKCWYFGHSHKSEPLATTTQYGYRNYRALYKGLAIAEDKDSEENTLKLDKETRRE